MPACLHRKDIKWLKILLLFSIVWLIGVFNISTSMRGGTDSSMDFISPISLQVEREKEREREREREKDTKEIVTEEYGPCTYGNILSRE